MRGVEGGLRGERRAEEEFGEMRRSEKGRGEARRVRVTKGGRGSSCEMWFRSEEDVINES